MKFEADRSLCYRCALSAADEAERVPERERSSPDPEQLANCLGLRLLKNRSQSGDWPTLDLRLSCFVLRRVDDRFTAT